MKISSPERFSLYPRLKNVIEDQASFIVQSPMVGLAQPTIIIAMEEIS
jgi:hypothetical protein